MTQRWDALIAEEISKSEDQHAIYIAYGDFISKSIFSGGRTIVGGDMLTNEQMTIFGFLDGVDSPMTDRHINDGSNANMTQNTIEIEQIDEGAWRVDLPGCTVAFVGVDGHEEAKRFVAHKLGIFDTLARYTVSLTDVGTNKILAIKTVREFVPTYGLKDAKELVERVQDGGIEILGTWQHEEALKIKLRFEDAKCAVSLRELPVVLPVPTPVPDNLKEQERFGGPSDLYLENVPKGQGVEAIKIIREELVLGLKDAYDRIKNTPCWLEISDDARNSQLRIRLEAIGCTTSVREQPLV